MAIVLKRLLHALTKIEKDHADESSIRLQLRKRSDCKTTANQYFLVKGSTSKRKGNDTKNTSCVIIPRSDVPERFFQIIERLQVLFIVPHKDFVFIGREEGEINAATNSHGGITVTVGEHVFVSIQ